MDYNQNNNYEDQEYIPPIPTITSNLFYGDLGKISDYVKEINLRNDLDQDIKQIMILSRREFLESNRPDLIDDQIDKIISDTDNLVIKRSNDIINFLNKIDLFQNKIFIENIKNKISDYVGCKKDFVKLDTENYIIYEEMLPTLNLDSNTLEYINQIIIPDNIQLLDEYKTVIEQSKIELKKKEEILLLKQYRKDLIQILTLPMLKIIKFDSAIRELYENLNPLLNSFMELDVDLIYLNQNLWNKTNNFLQTIRLSEEQKKK